MEFDEVVVKESPGLCRCCLSEGCYKDLGSEYSWMGDTEIYADMLLECFDIGVSQHAEGPNGPNRLICEVCITRLRDACNFKKQVLDSEKRFIDMLHRGDFKSKGLVFPSDMKQEAEALDVEYLDDLDFGDDAEDLLKTDTEAEPSQSEDITVASLPPVKRGRGRPRKSAATPVKPERRAKMAKLEDKPRSSKAAAKDNEPTPKVDPKKPSSADHEKQAIASKRARIRDNLLTLLECSTVVPFRLRGKTYRCYHCQINFCKIQQLKDHTKTEHGNPKTFVVKSGGDVLLKLEVSEIECRLCSSKMENFEQLLLHLILAHDKTIEPDIQKYIILFKLSDDVVKCLLCGEEFIYFHFLLRHMHKEHTGQALSCEYCGIHMSTENSLKRHRENKHGNQRYPCRFCDKVFASTHSRADHENRIHGDEAARQCHICNEVFGSNFKRDTHLAAVHNLWKTRFECTKCGKVFRHKQQLVKHDRRIHLKEKNYTCDVCGFKFFQTSELKLHSTVHTGEKAHECELCNKRFSKKKHLMVHMRIHTNDRRYVCSFCDKAFVQSTSLKLHLRVHHSVS